MDAAAEHSGPLARQPDVPRPPIRRSWPLLESLLLMLCSSAAAALESRTLELGEFDRVHFSGHGTVRLTQGSNAQLAARGDEALLSAMKIETRDGALYIQTSGIGRELLLDLQVANLTEFVSEGDGRITGDDLSFGRLRLEGNGGGSFELLRLVARELEVRSRGATRFELTGQVDEQRVELSGTGAYRAAELISECATIHVDGASDVRLWAERLLDLSVAGSADVWYAGAPRVEQRVSGVASVQRIARIAI